MASPVISVRITADASAATKGIQDTTQNLDKLSDSAADAAKKTRDISGGIESVGDTAGRATTGLRDMSDAVAMAGFPQLAAGMGIAATGLESLDGAANLYKASQEAITKGGQKLLDMMKKSTIATKLYGVAQKIATIATSAFNAVMKLLRITLLTNPIFLIAAILIAIGVAFVLLYQKCEGFRKIVDKVFTFVWNLIKNVFNWFKGIVRTVIDWVIAYFQLIWKIWKAVFTTVVNIVRGAIDTVKGVIRSVIDVVKTVVNNVRDVFAKVVGFITKPFKDAMNWVKNHFRVKLPSWIPGVGKSSAAWTVSGPSPAVSRGGGGGGTITINITGAVDPAGTAKQVRRLLRSDSYRVGLVAS